MRRIAFLTALCCMLPVAPAQAQSLDVGAAHTGVSIGNSQVWNGLRINWRDANVQRVNGINITLWRPHDNADFAMHGIALGVVGPDVATLRGLGVGLGGVVAHRQINGIALAGLGVVSEGDIHGAAVAGLGTVAQGDIRGINVAGLGVVSQGELTGVNVSGLGTVAQGSIRGINVAGLGVVTQGRLQGLNVAGLANVAEGHIHGLNLAGLAIVGGGGVRGINIGGLAIVGGDRVEGINVALGAVVSSESIRGLTATGYRVQAPAIDGLSAALGMLRTDDLRGLGIAGYNHVRGTQNGITIGIYNSAEVLRGVQIGVLNRAKNNRPPFRWLPLVNAHFD